MKWKSSTYSRVSCTKKNVSFFQSGDNAAALIVAEQYVQAFGNLAKTSNTVILPANTGDAASMVAQVSYHITRDLQSNFAYENF